MIYVVIFIAGYLAGTINGLMKEKVQIILVTHRFEEIVPDISYVMCVKDCKVFLQGKRDKVLTPEQMSRLYDKKTYFRPS